MNSEEMKKITDTLLVTAKTTCFAMDDETAQAYMVHLEKYDFNDVMYALIQCQQKARGRLCLADVIDLLPKRPDKDFLSVDEAWNLALSVYEDTTDLHTYAMTNEVLSALEDCKEILNHHDMYGARKAFYSSYQNAVNKSLANGEKPKWFISPGNDKRELSKVIRDAQRKGRITSQAAERMLPPPEPNPNPAGMKRIKAMAKKVNKSSKDTGNAYLEEMRSMFNESTAQTKARLEREKEDNKKAQILKQVERQEKRIEELRRQKMGKRKAAQLDAQKQAEQDGENLGAYLKARTGAGNGDSRASEGGGRDDRHGGATTLWGDS